MVINKQMLANMAASATHRTISMVFASRKLLPLLPLLPVGMVLLGVVLGVVGSVVGGVTGTVVGGWVVGSVGFVGVLAGWAVIR